jgi:hypothetical protein
MYQGNKRIFRSALPVLEAASRLRFGRTPPRHPFRQATGFAKNAGVIGLFAQILVWVSAYTAYL